MNEIKIFNNPQFGEIRTATTESGEPLFCLTDLCSALKLTNPSKVKSQLDDDLTLSYPIIDSLGRNQNATFVNESGLYTVILRSDSILAKPMQKWVTSEVLPAIRKTGGYIATKEEDTPEVIMARALIVANSAIENHKKQLAEKERQLALAQKQLEYQAPMVNYANEVLSSTSGHTATTIAAELNMSAITLNELLVKARFIRRTGKKSEYSICASHQGKGYVTVTTFKYEGRDGGNRSKIDLHYTEAGRMKIHEIFNRAKNASVIVERKGRYFINYDWKESEKTA